MRIKLRETYENGKAMFEKMNKKEIDTFLLANRSEQDKVHLKNKIKNQNQRSTTMMILLKARQRTIRSVCKSR